MSDISGAVVPNAKVTIKNNSTGVVLTTISNSAGNCQVVSLVPGTYDVEVVANGFKTAERPSVLVEAVRPTQGNVTHEVGNITQAVTVKATSLLISAAQTSVGHVVTNRRTVNLLLNRRNVYSFITICARGTDENRQT